MKYFILLLMISFSPASIQAQNSPQQMVRIARIQVDPLQLDAYNRALKEQMHTAIRKEPGVLSYHAVADKKNPAHITILEVYADSIAYQKHIVTPHFRKYKETVKDMVQSLQLEDVSIVGIAKKPGQ